jgi:photosystem II stability/assembly factor-like uncharacterized protein
VFVATGSKGIYKSSDGGQTWTQKNKGLPQSCGGLCQILSLAIDPSQPETVWAGTQVGGAIVRSTDGGDNWYSMGLTDHKAINAIAVYPTNGNTILAGASALGEGSIFKSTDGGQTWQLKVSGIASVMNIVFDPRNPQWVYAVTEGYGVLRSFDGGEGWHDYSTGIFYPVMYSLAITEDDPPLLIAGSYSSGLYWIRPPAPKDVFLPIVTK